MAETWPRSLGQSENTGSRLTLGYQQDASGMTIRYGHEKQKGKLKMALHLTQYVGDKIYIGTEDDPQLIVITTMCVNDSGRVRYSIDAPDDIIILRDKVFERGQSGL